MATATVSVVSAHNSGPVPLYIETQDQFGATVFDSPGNTIGVNLGAADVAVGSDIAIALDGSSFGVTGNITYQLSASATLLNSLPQSASLQWVDFTQDANIGPAFRFDAAGTTSGTVYFTPSDSTSIVLTAVVDAPLSWEYPAKLTNVITSCQAVSGWTE